MDISSSSSSDTESCTSLEYYNRQQNVLRKLELGIQDEIFRAKTEFQNPSPGKKSESSSYQTLDTMTKSHGGHHHTNNVKAVFMNPFRQDDHEIESISSFDSEDHKSLWGLKKSKIKENSKTLSKNSLTNFFRMMFQK